MKLVFFYGLFMDPDLLKEKGLNPESPCVAYADSFGLRIGERATLLPSSNERAYGQIMSLEEDELDKLYGDKSVADYVPEVLEVTQVDGTKMKAWCYNLPKEKLTGKNVQYAKSLAEAAKKVGLPSQYIGRIREWIE